MNNPSYRDELFDLLAELGAEGLSKEQVVRLRQILENHPETREIYVEAVRLSQSGFYSERAETGTDKVRVAAAE